MFGLLFAVSAVVTIVQLIKELITKPIPAENWANKELYNKDVINGVPIKQRMKNLENGKYKIANSCINYDNIVHVEPHRDPVSGKIIIENSSLYYEDINKYGAYQAQQWVKQGKYNLTPEELKKKMEYLESKYK